MKLFFNTKYQNITQGNIQFLWFTLDGKLDTQEIKKAIEGNEQEEKKAVGFEKKENITDEKINEEVEGFNERIAKNDKIKELLGEEFGREIIEEAIQKFLDGDLTKFDIDKEFGTSEIGLGLNEFKNLISNLEAEIYMTDFTPEKMVEGFEKGTWTISTASLLPNSLCQKYAESKDYFPKIKFPNQHARHTIGLADILPPEVRKVTVIKNGRAVKAERNSLAGGFFDKNGKYAEILDGYSFIIEEYDEEFNAETYKKNFAKKHGSREDFFGRYSRDVLESQSERIEASLQAGEYEGGVPTQSAKREIDFNERKINELKEKEIIYDMALRYNLDPHFLSVVNKQQNEYSLENENEFLIQVKMNARSIQNTLLKFQNQFSEKEAFIDNKYFSAKFIAFFVEDQIEAKEFAETYKKLSGAPIEIKDVEEQAAKFQRSISGTDIQFANPESLEKVAQMQLPTEGRLSSPYGMRMHPTKHVRKMHRGIDIANKSGTPIHAAQRGKIVFAGWKGDNGNLIVIDHGHGYKTVYAHLSSFSVKVGDEVNQGDTFAKMGTTGASTGPHLHFGVIKDGVHQDPQKYITKGVYKENSDAYSSKERATSSDRYQNDVFSRFGLKDKYNIPDKDKYYKKISKKIGDSDQLRTIFNSVFKWSKKYGLQGREPWILAMNMQESSMGKALVGDGGEAKGPMQVHPRLQFDHDKMRTDLDYGVMAGVEVLATEKMRSDWSWLKSIDAYNGGGNWTDGRSTDQRYGYQVAKKLQKYFIP